MYIVSVNEFSNKEGKSIDKNGKAALYLGSLDNKTIPERARVLNGTVAEQRNIKAGKSYILNITEGDTNEYGVSYNYNVVSEVSAVELMEMDSKKLLSSPKRNSETVTETQPVEDMAVN